MDRLHFDHREFWIKSLWVIIFTLAVFAANMATSDIRGDSILYASVAKNILTLHSPLILHYDGSIYLNKPPLLFWLVALCLKLFGYTVFAVNLAIVITGLVLNLSFFYFVARIFRQYNLAYFAVFCLNTTFVVYKASHALRMESMTAAFILLALLNFWLYLKSEHIRYMIWMGVHCGLAILTKGFLGLMPFALILLYPMMGDRHIVNLRFIGHCLLAIVVSFVVCGWWYIYISLNTNFIHHFFYNEVAARLFNGALQSGGNKVAYDVEPIYKYVLLLGRDYFMYLPFFFYGAYRLYRGQHDFDREGVKIVSIFAIFSWVVIHFISTRSARYLYEFYLMSAIIVAYAVVSIPALKQRNFVNLLKFVSLAYMLFTMATPMRLSWNTYTSIPEFKHLSENMNLPLIVDLKNFESANDRAGLQFFLPASDFQPMNSAHGSYLTILRQNCHQSAQALALKNYLLVDESRRLCLIMVPREDLLADKH